jgi:hypothetical protein
MLWHNLLFCFKLQAFHLKDWAAVLLIIPSADDVVWVGDLRIHFVQNKSPIGLAADETFHGINLYSVDLLSPKRRGGNKECLFGTVFRPASWVRNRLGGFPLLQPLNRSWELRSSRQLARSCQTWDDRPKLTPCPIFRLRTVPD